MINNKLIHGFSSIFKALVCLVAMTICLAGTSPVKATGPATIPTSPTAASGLTGPSSAETAGPSNPQNIPAQGTNTTATSERTNTTDSAISTKPNTE